MPVPQPEPPSSAPAAAVPEASRAAAPEDSSRCHWPTRPVGIAVATSSPESASCKVIRAVTTFEER
jgi:hypothetical protein